SRVAGEERQELLLVDDRVCCIRADRRAVRAPRPTLGRLDHPGARSIQRDVADGLVEVPLRLDHLAVEATQPHDAAPFVATIVQARVTALKTLETAAQGRCLDLQ